MKHNGRCCLLIDTDPEDQEIFIDALHSVTTNTGCYAVCSGDDALFTILQENVIPEYIFTEINLPGMQSTEFIRKVREIRELKNVPVVVYTSQPHEAVADLVKSLGAVTVHSKTNPDGLKTILRKYFQQ